MTSLRSILLLLALFLISTTVTGSHQDFNITDILSEFSEYTDFNKYLTQTKLNDEINSRQTLTVLVLNNTSLTKFLANQPLSVVKTALSIHVLLDYFDMPKLLSIGGGTMTTTTLYQTTGNAAGSTGFVNITDLVGNKVGFGSGQGSKLESLYLKTVKLLPYNISVLEITSPIIAPGILMGNIALPKVNVTSVIEQAGCKTFARLVLQTGVWKVFSTAETNGLTVFAPTDAAFKASGLPNLGNMTNTEFISLLLYHAIPSYVPKVSLKYEVEPVSTLASNQVDKFYLAIRTNPGDDSATLSSGIDDSRIESMVFDSVPICVFRINSLLLPSNLFTKSPSPAPSTPDDDHEPASAPTPRSIALTPSPAVSPPAPSTISPDGVPAPADAPTADMGGGGDTKTSGALKAPIMFLALVIMLLLSGFIVA